MIVFVTLLTTIFIGGLLISHEIANYRKYEQFQRNKYIAEQKKFIKDMVLSEARYIVLRKNSMEKDYIDELKFNVEQAYELAEKSYNELDGFSIEKKQELLKEIISFLKSKDHFSKIFIGSLNGEGIYYPGHPQYENSNLIRHVDVHGNMVVKSELDFLSANNEGFIYYGQNNTINNDSIPVKKVVYLKKFKPLGWYFGGKIYLEDHYNIFKRDIAEKISSVRFTHSGYVFINHINGMPIVLDGEVYNGKYNFYDGSDTARYNVFLKELTAAKVSDEGGYFTYSWNKIDETKLSPKLSYVRYIKELDWLVGAGFYLDDIDQELANQKKALLSNLQKSIAGIIFALIVLLLIEGFIINYFDKHYKSDFKKFFMFFKHASEKYEKIDTSAFYFEELQKTAIAVNSMIDTHEEIHRKLVEEQVRATQSDKLKTAFLANMSHEIRTPMNAIVGFSEILSTADAEIDNKEEIFHYIRSSSHQLLKLIDDIVDISKIESNQLKITKRAFNLHRFMKGIDFDVERMLDPQSKSPEYIKELNFPDDFMLNTDEFRLRQVLLNLLGNAIKFTDEGTIKIKVLLEQDGIFFSVKDTGIGISEKEHELIFERFIQSEIVNGTNYRGTGLGLAISKNIVDLLGGKIQLKSKLGKGSEFYFTLPV